MRHARRAARDSVKTNFRNGSVQKWSGTPAAGLPDTIYATFCWCDRSAEFLCPAFCATLHRIDMNLHELS